jgi:hypothetical protein
MDQTEQRLLILLGGIRALDMLRPRFAIKRSEAGLSLLFALIFFGSSFVDASWDRPDMSAIRPFAIAWCAWSASSWLRHHLAMQSFVCERDRLADEHNALIKLTGITVA